MAREDVNPSERRLVRAGLILLIEEEGTWAERLWLPLLRLVHRRSAKGEMYNYPPTEVGSRAVSKIDVDVAPYRVEWRPNLVTNWSLSGLRPTREEADALAVKTLEDHGGYCRLLTQHVISSSAKPGAWESAG